ncbi:hypothetical protein EJ07DRAFT_134551 [Lizonia empirigonia]|nr:hypothetical protein EJ07DRAFT_134551 [Lizonia empirigonia]
MATAIQGPASLQPSSSFSGETKKQDKKGKQNKKGKGKQSQGEVSVEAGVETSKRREGHGIDEIQSDSLPESDEENDEIYESELSSHNGSDTDDGGSNEELRKKKIAAKEARRAERPKEYYEKRDVADKKQVAAIANEGFTNYMKTRAERTPPEKRPAPVEKQWRGLYPLLKFQWKEGGEAEMSKEKTEIFKRANETIERYCNGVMNVDIHLNTKANALYLVQLKELEKELVGKPESSKVLRRKQLLTECAKTVGQPSKDELLKNWRFPTEELCAQIYVIEKALKELGEKPSNDACRKKISDYERRLAAAQTDFAKTQLSEKKIRAEKMLDDRKHKTEKLLQTILIFLDNLEQRGIPPNSVLSSRAHSVFQDFVSGSSENAELYNALKAELDRPTLEQVDKWDTAIRPMCDFVACVNNQDIATEQNISKVRSLVTDLSKIDKQIVSAGGQANCLPMSLVHEISKQFEEGHSNEVQLNITSLLGQLRQQEAAVSLIRAIEFGTLVEDLGADTEGTVTNTTVSSRSVKTEAAGASIMTTTDLSEDFLRNVDLNSLKLGTNVTEVFQYENGMTEHGPLAATRPSPTGITAHNRYFVNAGLEEPGLEYYKVFKGSDLGPGGADRLAELKVVDFVLKQRLKDVKGDHPVLRYGPVVGMPRSEGYVHRGKKKERLLDAYIFVRYKGLSDPDVLSRTQFSQFAKKFGENTFAEHEKIYRNTRIYFEAAKAQKLHPKTKKPLTAADLQKTPWLFPQTDRYVADSNASKEHGEGSDDDDDYDPLQGAEAYTSALNNS